MTSVPILYREGNPEPQVLYATCLEDGTEVAIQDRDHRLAGGRKFSALLIALDEGDITNLALAVIDVEKMVLVDVVDMYSDHSCGFWGGTPFMLGRNWNAIAIECTHHNSSLGFQNFTFLTLVDGKLQVIEFFGLLSSRGGYGTNFEESFDVLVFPVAGASCNGLASTVKKKRNADDPGMECRHPLKTAVTWYRTAYTWDSRLRRVTMKSKELADLTQWNKDNN